jgi:hypothetical protein
MTNEQRGQRRGGGRGPRRRVELAAEILAEREESIAVSVRARVWQGNQTVRGVPVQLFHRDRAYGRLSPSNDDGRVVWEVLNLSKADRHWFEVHASFEYGDGGDVVSPRVYVGVEGQPSSRIPHRIEGRRKIRTDDTTHDLWGCVVAEDGSRIPGVPVTKLDSGAAKTVERVNTDEWGVFTFPGITVERGGHRAITVIVPGHQVEPWRVRLYSLDDERAESTERG